MSFANSCLICGTSLHGPLSHLFYFFGIRRSARNPNVCNRCAAHLQDDDSVEVTILFADLSGFTKLTNEIGPEKSFEVLQSYFSMAKEALFQHDAYIDKFIGDSVMAFFNVPIRNPQHSANALKAAIAIQRGMHAVSTRIGLNLTVKIGIASGKARLGRLGGEDDQEFSIIGEAVNLASRLQSLAQPGEILVDAITLRQSTESVHELAPEWLQPKGFDAPVMAYRLDNAGCLLLKDSLGSAAKPLPERLGLGSVLFTILGAPCAVAGAVGPLAVALGVATAAGAASTFINFLDAAPIRIPLQVLGVAGAVLNLYVVRHAAQRRSLLRAGGLSPRERRRERTVIALAVFTLLAVALETYYHIVVKELSWFGPPL